MPVAELRFAVGVTRAGREKNEYIRGPAKVKRLGLKLREATLRWHSHVMTREESWTKDAEDTVAREEEG